MLNGVQEKELNADINIKIRKYPGASLTEMLDHIRPSLRKEPDQIIIHAVTTLQTHHVDSTLKRRGSDRFQVVSTWNPRGVFVGKRSNKRL